MLQTATDWEAAKMTGEELEDALRCELALRIYTDRIGKFVEGRMSVLHWPAAPDAFLFETVERTDSGCRFYWIKRSDPSLIAELA